jgi:hypothetical protein
MNQWSRERALTEWFERAQSRLGQSGFEDLHVTALDPALRGPDAWYEAGLQLLDEACALRDARRARVTVAVAFTLRSESLPAAGIANDDLSPPSLMDEVTPPSVYLLQESAEELTLDPKVRRLSRCPGEIRRGGARCYIREWSDPSDGVRRRVLWVTA